MEESEVKKDAALPPEITGVTCNVDKEEGTYNVFWSMGTSGDTFLLALFCYDDRVGDAVQVTGTSGTISGAVSDTAQYYVGVASKKNPEIYNKVPVFSTAPLILNQVSVLEDGNIDLDYAFTGMRTDAIQVSFSNTNEQIRKTVQLVPYDHRIHFKDYGLLPGIAYDMSFTAENRANKAKITYPLQEISKIESSVPVCTQLCLQKKEDGVLEYMLTVEDGFWSGGSLWISLYIQGQCAFEKTGIEAGGNKSYLFTVPEEAVAAGSCDTLYLRFQIEKERVLSKSAPLIRCLLPAPIVTGCRYISQNTMEVIFVRECRFPHKILMYCPDSIADFVQEAETYTPVAKGENREVITIPVNDGGSVSFSYQSGLLTGEKSDTYSRIQPAYYLLGTDIPFLVYNDRPFYKLDESVMVKLPQISGATWQAVDGHYFKISQQDSEYFLVLSDAVWKISDVNIRSEIKEDFHKFLNTAEDLFSPKQTRAIRRLAEKYLPQRLEEVLYYQGHYCENFAELFPGLELRADFETYQYVGDTSASLYLNGYTGTGRMTAPVVLKNGKLCADSFLALLSEGSYVDDPQQPTVKSVLCAYGGGGITDLSAPGISREYMGICYPEKFPSSVKEGAPQVCKNPAVLSAPTYKALYESLDVFRETGLPADGTSVLYLRGRTQLTPCVPVIVNGCPEKMPLGSTLQDALTARGREELPQHLVIRRQGMPVYLFGNAAGWENLFFLYPGDEVSWK